MTIDLFSTYFPTSVNQELVAQQHEKLRLWLAANMQEELDSRPGSVAGDLIVNPEAVLISSVEQALGNFTSDLDLANVSMGNIYNCEFVSDYIKNFSTTNYTDITSSGTVRLVFSDSAFRTIDRGVQFRSGTQIFMPRIYKDGNIRVLSPGQTRNPDSNDIVLSGVGNRFIAELSVYSMDTTTVTNLSQFEISEESAGLVEIYAVGDFWTRESNSSIQSLAEKTRITSVSANATNRSGLARLVRQEFPEVASVSPVLTGDFEMARQSVNPLGIAAPMVDLYVRTPLYGTILKEPFKLFFDDVSQSYFGEVSFLEVPLVIDKVTFSDETSGDLEFSSYFVSTDDKLPALSASGTTKNKIFINIPIPLNGEGTPILPPLTDSETGLLYQLFEITYRADPGLRIIDDFFSSPDTKPIGVDIQVKMFVPIDFSGLYINYTRKRGVKINQTKVSAETINYLTNVGWPDTYSDASIIDSMFYAGASNVLKVESDAELKINPCDFLLSEVPETATEAISSGVDIPVFSITGSNNFGYKAKDTEPVFEDNLHYAVGPRNISYLLDSSNIYFREVGNNVV